MRMGLLRRRTTALAAGASLVASAEASFHWTETSSVVPSSSDLRRGSDGEGAQVFAEVSFPARWLNWFEQAIQQQSDRTKTYSSYERFSVAAFVSFTDEPAESEAVAGEGREAFWGLRGGKAGAGDDAGDNAGDSDRLGQEESLGEEEESLGWAWWRREDALDSRFDQGASERQREAPLAQEGEGPELDPWNSMESFENKPSGVLNSRRGDSSWHPVAVSSNFWDSNTFEMEEAFDTDGSLVESTGSESELPRTEDTADELMHLDAGGAWAQSRRRLATDSDTSDASYSGEYEVEVRAEVNAPSTSWGGAHFKLKVGAAIPSQTGNAGHSIVFGQIVEGEASPKYFVHNLERGCYVIFTVGGDRPYDIIWTVSVDGVEVMGASGGGEDWHTFGVGGALCGLDSCYSLCYNELEYTNMQNVVEENQCANYGDLLAPVTEPNGARCDCTEEEQLELRLDCLNLGCHSSQQCYNVNDAASEVTTTYVVRIVIYMTFEESFSVTSLTQAVSIWLNLDPTYVDLEYIGGHTQEDDMASLSRRRRNLAQASTVEVEGDRVGARRLASGIFKRIEIKIIAFDEDDVSSVKERVAQGVGGLNDVLQSYEATEGTEETGETELSTAAAYTAECTVSSGEFVAVSDMPVASIASSGGDATLEGLADDDEDETHFTRSAQFIFGALLVVVVAIALSIVACVVCCMKRKQRLDFERQNEPVGGAPKPVQVFDPWASVDRNFQKPTSNGNSATYSSAPPVTNAVMMNGSRSVAPNVHEG